MDRPMLDYYRILILLLSTVGLWPHQREKLRLLQNVVISFVITTLVVVQLTPFASGKATKQDILKNMSFTFMMSGVATKYFTFLLQTEATELLEGINRDWKTANDEELKIIKEYADMGKRYSIFFAVFLYLSTIGAMALHFSSTFLDIVWPLNETRLYKSPIVTEYFIDEQKYYFRIAMFQCLTILICSVVCVVTDSVTFMWMMHSACLYRLVSYRINVAVVDCIKGSYATEKAYNRNRKEGMARAVMMHNRAYTFFNELKSAITLVYSILLILGVTSLSTNLFSLTVSWHDEGNAEDTLLSLLYINCELSYMFYINYIVQQVNNSCDDVFTAMYDTEWYKSPVSTQKLLLFIMLKSALPPDFKILVVYYPSIECFSKLLRTSMSYFTVMSSVQ